MAASGAAWAASARAEAPPVRLGLVGVGSRGTSLLRTLLDLEGVEIVAIADIDDNHLSEAQQMATDAGQPKPQAYPRGDEDFRRLVERPDLDAVLTATPWEWHARVALASMRAGKPCAVEVPAVVTLDEAWELLETSDETGVWTTMLENWVFRREPLAILNMVRAGLLGDLVHAQSGYNHDVRAGKFDARGGGPDQGELRWRGWHSVFRDGNLYPTHQFAPIAMATGVNHGVKIDFVVAMASPSRGMNRYAADRWGADHPNARREYANGDVTVTLVQLSNGVTVTQYHDTQSWHPRDDAHKYHGTKGMIRWPFPEKGSIYTTERHWDGEAVHADRWRPLDPFLDEFDHSIWRKYGERALQFGHNGADWMELRAFVEAVRGASPPAVPLTDALTWSALAPLSEQSIARRSAPVEAPDFTRGGWKTAVPFSVDWPWV